MDKVSSKALRFFERLKEEIFFLIEVYSFIEKNKFNRSICQFTEAKIQIFSVSAGSSHKITYSAGENLDLLQINRSSVMDNFHLFFSMFGDWWLNGFPPSTIKYHIPIFVSSFLFQDGLFQSLIIITNRIILFLDLLVDDQSRYTETRSYSVLQPLFFHKKRKQTMREIGSSLWCSGIGERQYRRLASSPNLAHISGVIAVGLVAFNDWRTASWSTASGAESFRTIAH